MTKKRHDLVDFSAEKIHETDKAFLLKFGDKEAWFPKSVIEEHDDGTFTTTKYWIEEKEFENSVI